jgi:hypothetical protein
LVVAYFGVAVDEDVFPGHEHVFKNDEAVGLVEPGGKRIIEGIAAGLGERTARIELHAGRIDRDHDAVGVSLVAGLQGVDAAQVNVIRIEPAGGV